MTSNGVKNRLLIITQKVNKNDSVLSFFHAWIAEFAKHFSRVTVVCLEEGEHSLPENVSVFSLGKEKGYSRGRKIHRFYTIKRTIDGLIFHRLCDGFGSYIDCANDRIRVNFTSIGNWLLV